jgi:hypothetical protein
MKKSKKKKGLAVVFQICRFCLFLDENNTGLTLQLNILKYFYDGCHLCDSFYDHLATGFE